MIKKPSIDFVSVNGNILDLQSRDLSSNLRQSTFFINSKVWSVSSGVSALTLNQSVMGSNPIQTFGCVQTTGHRRVFK